MPSGSIKRATALVALFAVSASLPALAQGNAASDYPAACAESKVSARDRDDAHALYVTAKRFLDESAYDKAISLLKDAYTLNCSVHDFLPVIATAYERKADHKQALRALEEYLARVPAGPDISKDDLQAREKIERRIRNLKDLIASQTPIPSATVVPTVVPTVPPPAPSASVVPTVAPPASETPPPPPPTTGRSALPLIVSGVGVALAGAGTGVFVVGSNDYAEADKACPIPPGAKERPNCGAAINDKGNTARTYMGLGIGGLIAGGVAIAGGLIWYFVQPTKHAEAKVGKTVKQPYVTPLVTPNFAGASAGFSF